MEEDIENIERVIDYIQLESPIIQGIGNAIYTDSLKKILKRYKELEEENKRYRESDYETICMENNHLQEQMDKLNDYFIPISVIQNKIDEIKQDKNCKYYDMFLETRDIEETISILQELLEERNK